MSPGFPGCTRLGCGHDGPAVGDARGQDQELAHRQAGPRAGVRVAAAAPHLPGRRQSPAQDAREPVEDARARWSTRSRPPSRARSLVPAGHAAVTVAQSLPHGHVAAVHAMAREARPARAARPGRPAAGPGPGPDHLPGRASRARSCRRSPGGATSRSAPTSILRTRPPMRSTRRWTGWSRGVKEAIEKKIVRSTFRATSQPKRVALFDLVARGWKGTHCPWGRAGIPVTAKRVTADRLRVVE